MYKQQGTAVFMSLFIMTLITAMTAIWMMQTRIHIRRTQQMIYSDQVYLQAQSIIALSKEMIVKKINKFPVILPEIKMHNSKILGRIDDYQARLNINNLSDKDTRNAFIELVLILDKTKDRKYAATLADNITAWVTPIKLLTLQMGLINTKYNEKPFLYRAANRPFASISELRLVSGITPEIYFLLERYISALPPGTAMNLANASPLLLRAFRLNKPPLKSEKSNYFLVSVEVIAEHQDLTLFALLRNKIANSKSQVDIIWQSEGTY